MENVLIATVLSFVVTYFSIPILIRVAELKHLYDEPDERKTHKQRIPTLGGIGFFSGFIIAATVCVPALQNSPFQYMMAAFFIIFMVGMKDDIVGLSPLKKLIGQLVASFAIIYLGNLQITSMYGFMGITTLPSNISLMLTYFYFVVVINAFNLIDGVDGHAGSIGLLVSAVLGAYFLHVGEITYAVLGFALAGGLASFLIYNISPARIFMGDTGSLMIGLVNAVLVLKFIEVAGNPTSKMPIDATPAVAIAILIVPLFDTLRVFSVRMLQGRSPFSADRNHIHHYLLDLRLDHRQTTLVSVSVNAVFIAGAYLLQGLGTTVLTIAVVGAATTFTGVLYLARKRKQAVKVAVTTITQPAAQNAAAPKILRVTTGGVLQDK
ncbi:undecaprenyl/decaprenyl-phosphate alpha-N-acetylglucosaminyl 1-phosphate transferase [Chitinophaga varians]|uniref:Undecaprenyl/decaprenyl-phosphate alpha-N-acetylglucosaminyl 1-phosphate transferase n=1 Tax=Chitinophaga varians TaxID=2202339 RepID=A0A847RN95_9BACT|nr:MraY family glycosyltransferase [Chitinophaga varians]NLR64556.1 undecaprenyl/decaprenyl-phosphate alpha-N-acetylglucosaminyl 1-phosphate transferase [Chitinophaga varians]